MICCSPETLDRNTELSPDLAAFVASGDVSAKDALQMMPEVRLGGAVITKGVCVEEECVNKCTGC